MAALESLSICQCIPNIEQIPIVQQMGRTGRTDEGDQKVMMPVKQNQKQTCAHNTACIDENDIFPMILSSLVTGKPFSQIPFLCRPDPLVAKRHVFLCGMLSTEGVLPMEKL